jgi:seryl-tRNA synthetase
MLDIGFIRENKELVQQGVKDKGRKVDISELLRLDRQRRVYIRKVEELRARKKKQGKKKSLESRLIRKDGAYGGDKRVEEIKKQKRDLRAYEQLLRRTEARFRELMLQVPNLPAKDVKVGRGEDENETIKTWGKKPNFDFEPKDHIELGRINKMIDIERAAKVSGSRFYYLTGQAVEIEIALVRFALDKLKQKGFIPVIPPHIISEKAMRGMGYLEHGEDREVYHLVKDNQYLIGTSEQAIGPMHMDEILEVEDLPLRYVGFSACYRREAGSYGKDTKGILRTHQFDKIEMFSFCLPTDSEKEHQMFLKIEEEIMQDLKLPYQVIKMCTGDLGDPAAKKFDIEAWIPSQKKYRETHSTSNTTDFQARRLNIRYRNPRTNQTEHVHMVNGTAIAIGRMLIAIMENYQTKDGKIEIPKVLGRTFQSSLE